MVKCYNQVPSASTNPESVKNNNPLIDFLCKLVKKRATQISLPRDVERASHFNITAP